MIEARQLLTGLLIDLERQRLADTRGPAKADTLLDSRASHNRTAAPRSSSALPSPDLEDPWQEDDPLEVVEPDDTRSAEPSRARRPVPDVLQETAVDWSERVLGAKEPDARLLARFVAERTTPRRIRQTHPPGWPERATYGPDHWPQLRWRPKRALDDGQRRLDRFELGEWWWNAIYADPRTRTERLFNDFISKERLAPVVWAAPGATGRLPNPAFARVVVSGRRYRAIAVWLLALPKPGWGAEAWDFYLRQADVNTADAELVEMCDSIERQPAGLRAIMGAEHFLRSSRRSKRTSP